MLPRRLESSCRKSESKREIRIVNNPLLADLLSNIISSHVDLCIRRCVEPPPTYFRTSLECAGVTAPNEYTIRVAVPERQSDCEVQPGKAPSPMTYSEVVFPYPVAAPVAKVRVSDAMH